MKNQFIGILALIFSVAFLVVSLLLYSGGEFFSAALFQLNIVLIVAAFVFSLLYLVKNFSLVPKKSDFYLGGALGGILIIYTGLVSFGVLKMLDHFNWIIVIGLIFLTLTQIGLLRQRRPETTILRTISTPVVLACNAFPIVFFIGQWSYYGLSLWINITLIVSVLFFLIGFFAPVSQKK